MTNTRASMRIRIKDPRDIAAWEQFHEPYASDLYKYARARGLSCGAGLLPMDFVMDLTD